MIDTNKLCREFDLLDLAQKDTRLKKVGQYWIGACPFCGGVDRFTIKTKGQQTKYYCRGCGHDRYHDVIDYIMQRETVDFYEACRRMASGKLEHYETDPAHLAEIERQRQERATLERREREKRLQEFSTRELGEEYHARLAKENYAWWERQGIPPAWVDWWKLGYLPEKTFNHNDQLYTRSAYTIPKFDLNWQRTNIDYRIIDPPPGAGKYRFESGLNLAVFLSRPDLSAFPEEITLTEGSKKAMVTHLHTFPETDHNMVIGLPSKAAFCNLPERLKHCQRVWIALDPDATREARKLAQAIGRAARVITLPFKIDDGFLSYGFTWQDFQKAMRWAS